MPPPMPTRIEGACPAVPAVETPEQLLLPWAPPPDLSELFRRVFRRLRIKSPVADISAAFHPFPGLHSTISLRSGQVLA